jgi:hypothetical protein
MFLKLSIICMSILRAVAPSQVWKSSRATLILAGVVAGDWSCCQCMNLFATCTVSYGKALAPHWSELEVLLLRMAIAMAWSILRSAGY